MKAQISAEMILLLVVLLAVVALVATNLMSSAKKASSAVENSTEKIVQGLSNTCVSDEQCPSGRCVNGFCEE